MSWSKRRPKSTTKTKRRTRTKRTRIIIRADYKEGWSRRGISTARIIHGSRPLSAARTYLAYFAPLIAPRELTT